MKHCVYHLKSRLIRGRISTFGVPFESKAISVVLPSQSVHSVTIVGKPLEPGVLTIRGCVAQIPGSAPREFVLPLSTDEDEEKRLQQRSRMECEAGRFKYSGLDSRPWERLPWRRTSEVSSSAKKPSSFLECKVVPAQPLLRIRRTSLIHGAVMLYNGEM